MKVLTLATDGSYQEVDIQPGSGGEQVYFSKGDITSECLAYRGDALTDINGSVAGWRIKKLLYDGTNYTELLAEGSSNFDKVWDNRLTYSYS